VAPITISFADDGDSNSSRDVQIYSMLYGRLPDGIFHLLAIKASNLTEISEVRFLYFHCMENI
jgi:hypothetical protein